MAEPPTEYDVADAQIVQNSKEMARIDGANNSWYCISMANLNEFQAVGGWDVEKLRHDTN
jgi:hypothetical protein